MSIGSVMYRIKEDDTIILYDNESQKKRIISLKFSKGRLNTDKGFIVLSDIVGMKYGDTISTQLGFEYTVLPINLFDFIMKKLNRLTQIVYPKDAAYIAFKLDVKPGDTVIESGIGSGAMSCVFAHYIGKNGRLISYEIRDEFIENAYSNIKKVGFEDRVEIKHRDIAEGFDETDADSIFLDVKEPWLYLRHAYNALKAGGMLGILIPTVNQAEETLRELNLFSFIDLEVSELLLRKYKPTPGRFRPQDRMGAHTAFMIFARKI